MIIVSRGLVAVAERNGLWYIKPAGLFWLHPWLLHHKWRAYAFMNNQNNENWGKTIFTLMHERVHMCLRVSHKDNVYLLPGNIWGPIQVQYCVVRIYMTSHHPHPTFNPNLSSSKSHSPANLSIPGLFCYHHLHYLVVWKNTDYLLSITKMLLMIVYILVIVIQEHTK